MALIAMQDTVHRIAQQAELQREARINRRGCALQTFGRFGEGAGGSDFVVAHVQARTPALRNRPV
jgi:hypothetical protein